MKRQRELMKRIVEEVQLQEEDAGIVALHLFQFATPHSLWLSFSMTDTRARGRMEPTLISLN